MPRTYATKNGGTHRPFHDHRDPKPLFKESLPQRPAPGLWDDSLDSSHDVSSGQYRRPLQPVDDNITFNNSSAYDNSVDSAAGRVGVGFKSRNAKEDTFDALFADLKLKPVIRKPKLFLSTSGDPYSSGASSAETSLNKGAAAPGLFDSFTEVEMVKEKEKPKARAKPKTKSTTRLKSTKLAVHQDPATPKLSETLQVQNYIKFEHKVPMYMESPLLSRGLQTTSTPSLGGGSQRDLGSLQDTLDVSGINGIVLDNEVFEEEAVQEEEGRDEGDVLVVETNQDLCATNEGELPGCVARISLSDHTPSRSTCSRGSNKSLGPVKNLFLHDESPGIVGSSKSKVSTEDDEVSENITVNVQCICGSNLVTESQLIQCVNCLHFLHTDCVNLGDSAIAEVEQGLDWFCPTCRNLSDSDGASTFLSSPAGSRPRSAHKSLEEESVGDAATSRLKDSEMNKLEAEQGPIPSDCQHRSVSSNLCLSPSSSDSPSSSLTNASFSQGCHSTKIISALSDRSSIATRQSSGAWGTQVSIGPSLSTSEIRGKLDCTADVLALAASNQDQMSPLPFTSGHQAFVPTRQYSTASEYQSELAFSPKPSHNIALPDSKEQLDCTADVLALASKLGDMSPLPFLKPRATLFRKPPTQVMLQSPGLSAKPGKNWRRSLAAAKRETSMANTLLATSRLSMMPSPGTLRTRSSFYVVPVKPSTVVGATEPAQMSTLDTDLVEEVEEVEESVSQADHALTRSLADVELEPKSKSAEDQLLAVCTGGKVVTFEEVYTKEVMEGAVKVGEGAFGEVFTVGHKEGASVLKIIPFGGDVDINDEKQTTVEDIISEVTISLALSNLRESGRNCTTGFVEVRGAHVFSGDYPEQLLNLWDRFAEEKGTENERPDKLGFGQNYIALEFNNAGCDLEKFVFKNATQAFAVWKQVAHTLAVAEEAMEFEHRDLHWGNVLVKEVKGTRVCEYKLDGDVFKVESEDTLATIIDFSLSRAEVEGKLIFNNLSEDPAVFQGRGADQGGDYQFDIYRSMRQHNKDCWDNFRPKSNILWLHYLLTKMTVPGEVHYSTKTKKTSKLHKSGLSRMNALKKRLLDFNSAAEWVKREGERVDDV